MRRMRSTLMLLLALSWPALAFATGGGDDPLPPILLALSLVLVGAKVCGDLAGRIRMPPVLGELIFGIALGNASLLGVTWFESLKADATLDVMARLGVVLLLFEVGLESTVKQMLGVGRTAVAVATLGVIVPFGLGFGVGAWLLPHQSVYAHLFLGATLTATSVGITARVLKDLGHSQSPEARIILGAAVVDDVMGLVILAVVTGVIKSVDTGTALQTSSVVLIVLKALGFLVGALIVGMKVSPLMFGLASRLRGTGTLLATALTFCFMLSYIASKMGLAPIVGAYAAGLILESVHYQTFTDRGEHELEELVAPIGTLLIPIFFVQMGMHVDLRALLRTDVLGLATAITLAAIAGKQACALGVRGTGASPLAVGLGMIPRGEVGLIFANVGLGLHVDGRRVVDESLFAAVVIMVLVTTLVTPPALGMALGRAASKPGADTDGAAQ